MDVPEPLAALLRDYLASRDADSYISCTGSGKPLSQRNLLRILSTFGAPGGFHAFRRFRVSILESAEVPDKLMVIWLGHAPKTVTDRSYSQLRNNLQLRQKWCLLAGLGFELGDMGDKTGIANMTKTAA